MKLSKKLLSLLLCSVMMLGAVAIGGGGFAEVLDAFSVKASAAEFSPDITRTDFIDRSGSYCIPAAKFLQKVFLTADLYMTETVRSI